MIYYLDEKCKEMVVVIRSPCEQKNMMPHAPEKEATISASTISNLVNGKTKLQVYAILVLCNVLRVRISNLFGDNDVIRHRNFRITSTVNLVYCINDI